MNNIVNYAATQLQPFREKPFCAVDSLILSWLSNYKWPDTRAGIGGWRGVRLVELYRADWFETALQRLWDPESSQRLLSAVAASPRFRDIRAMGYVQSFDAKEEKQFAAMTFQLTPTLCYIAFRGTDATLIGWKEDFNLAFQCPVASQKAAAAYLEKAAAHGTGDILIGGHSKGGNLAVYAAATCSEAVRTRLKTVYSHDGPGFLDEMLQSEGFRAIESRIEKTIPQSSIIGMMLEQQEAYHVVRSDGVSILQHNPFSWQIEGDAFGKLEHLTADARYFDSTMNEWVRSIPTSDREIFVDSLFEILMVNNASTFAELRADWQKTVPAAVQAASGLDEKSRECLLELIRRLAALSVRNLPEMFRRPGEKQAQTDPDKIEQKA